jgi:hypothetical protein
MEALQSVLGFCITVKGATICGVSTGLGYFAYKCLKDHQEEAQIRERERQRQLNHKRNQEILRVMDYQNQNQIADKKQEQAQLLAQLEEVQEGLQAAQARARANN